ncbi:MAG TPA: PQQ-binding-like beta-propeller repeat protein [Streptosporangiaceae bacterium]|nr:PQQ-binding-like beta-propeller repeat protein [Streptosporangiaceae bacterium]
MNARVFRRLRLSCMVGLLAVTGCAAAASATGAGVSSTSAHGPGNGRVGTRTASCPAPPARHAWAEEVSLAGQVGWRTPLATHGNDVSPVVEPLVAGTVAVFAQDGSVHGLRLASGTPLWSFTGGQSVYAMWQWQDLVVVLTDQVSDHARLTGLDAATGAVRWTLRLPGGGLDGNLVATGDGGLAMVRADGTLEVVNLATGAVRWTRRTGTSQALAAAGGAVYFGVDGRLTAYDSQTGRQVWTTSGLPAQPAAQLAGGLLLVTSTVQGGTAQAGSALGAVTAVTPATGRIAWRFDPGPTVSVLAADPVVGVAVATYNPDRLYLLDPATGRPRWQAATAVGFGTVPLFTADGVIDVEGGIAGFGAVRVVDRDVANGRIRWQDALADPPVGNGQVVQAGQAVVVQGIPVHGDQDSVLFAYRLGSSGAGAGVSSGGAGGGSAGGGGLAWRISLPAIAAVTPVAVLAGRPGLLVQPADPAYACAAGGSAASASALSGSTASGSALSGSASR